MYLRLIGSSVECYKYLEPLYNDYRKLKFKNRQGSELVFVYLYNHMYIYVLCNYYIYMCVCVCVDIVHNYKYYYICVCICVILYVLFVCICVRACMCVYMYVDNSIHVHCIFYIELTLSHVDEFVDDLLRNDRVCDVILPRLQVRSVILIS